MVYYMLANWHNSNKKKSSYLYQLPTYFKDYGKEVRFLFLRHYATAEQHGKVEYIGTSVFGHSFEIYSHYGTECLEFLWKWEFIWKCIWKMVKPNENMHFSSLNWYLVWHLLCEDWIWVFDILKLSLATVLWGSFLRVYVPSGSELFFMTTFLLWWLCSFYCVYVPHLLRIVKAGFTMTLFYVKCLELQYMSM